MVRRLINVVQAAGLQVERIEMAPDGRLIVVPRALPLSTPNRPIIGTSGACDGRGTKDARVWEYQVLIDPEAPPGWTKVHQFKELGTERPCTLWGRPRDDDA